MSTGFIQFCSVSFLPGTDGLPTKSIAAVWLRPSKQIHAPIFNIKVRKQRRAIVSIWAFPNLIKELTKSSQIIKYVPIFFTVIATIVGLIAARESLCCFVRHPTDSYLAPSCRSQRHRSSPLFIMQSVVMPDSWDISILSYTVC